MVVRRRLAGLLAVPLLLVGGCGTSATPDDKAWVDTSVRALEDAAGNVATTRLALEQEDQHRFVGRAGLVIAQDAAGSAGGLVRSYLGGQPAPGRADDQREVAGLLQETEATLAEARVALASGAEDVYAALVARAESLEERLTAEAAHLQGGEG